MSRIAACTPLRSRFVALVAGLGIAAAGIVVPAHSIAARPSATHSAAVVADGSSVSDPAGSPWW